jgi:hypothetical protein
VPIAAPHGCVGRPPRLQRAPQPPPSAAVYRCSGGLRRRGAPFVARRAIPLHVLSLTSHRPPGIRSGRGRSSCGCYALYRGPKAPASRDPFPQIPAFEGRCIPAGFVTLPHRTAAGTPRSGASPVGAHRSSRCTASSGTDPWRPGGVPRTGGHSYIEWSVEECPVKRVQLPASGTGSERAKVASVAERNPPRALGPSAARPPEGERS